MHVVFVAVAAAIAGCCITGMALGDGRPLNERVDANAHDLLAALDGGSVGSYAVVGDSISFRGNSYHWFLRDFLEGTYGNAGDGYLAFSPGFKATGAVGRREGLDFRKQGNTWAPTGTNANFRDDAGKRSPDGIYTQIGGPGWIEVDFYGPSAIIHYVREVGAGIIRVELNGETIAELDASLSTGGPQLGLYEFATGQTDPTILSTLRLSLVGATAHDPQWTQLNGLQMTTGDPGMQFHRIARGGVGPDDFLSADPAIYADVLVSLAPRLLIVMLDPGRDNLFDIFYDDLNELLDFYETTLPETEIILISHHPFRPNREQITDWQLEIAQQRGWGFINFFDLHDDFNHLDSLGMLADSVHMSAIGGEWHGRYLYDILHGWNAPIAVADTFGSVANGGLYEVRNSDDRALEMVSQFGFSVTIPNIAEFTADFSSDTPGAGFVDVKGEWHVDGPGGFVLLGLYDWVQSRYVDVASGAIDQVETIDRFDDIALGNARRSTDNRVQLRVTVGMAATFSVGGFHLFVDDLKMRLH